MAPSRRPPRSRLGGLSPGTTYYYQLGRAQLHGRRGRRRSGRSRPRAPPPGAVTGTATGVGSTTATVNGTIDTNGAATRWQVQYGKVSQTSRRRRRLQTVANSASPVPVAAALTRPGTADGVPLPGRRLPQRRESHRRGRRRHVLHRAVQAAGAEPAAPRRPPSRTRSRRSGSPLTAALQGQRRGAGQPALRRQRHGELLQRQDPHRPRVGPVQPNCTFAAHVSFRRSHGKGVVPITVKIHYLGTGYLAGVKRVNHVKVGHK